MRILIELGRSDDMLAIGHDHIYGVDGSGTLQAIFCAPGLSA